MNANQPSNFDFFYPRSIGKISGNIQLLIVTCLYLSMIAAYYFEFKMTGKVAGYGPSVSLLFVPIYEELVFRGIFLKYFQSQFGNIPAIIIVSLLFGIWHLKNIFWMSPENLIEQILYTTLIIGPILALITLKLKTLWPAVILHFLNNFPYNLIIKQFNL